MPSRVIPKLLDIYLTILLSCTNMYVQVNIRTQMQQIHSKQKMNITDVRQKIKQVFDDVYEEQSKRVIVEKSGIVVGGVVSPYDLRRLDELDKKREQFFRLRDEMSQKFNDESEEEILENAAQAVRDVRHQTYKEKQVSKTLE